MGQSSMTDCGRFSAMVTVVPNVFDRSARRLREHGRPLQAAGVPENAYAP
jgi:hypothetical protein